MDLKGYNKLRNKISKKDFEGNNKDLDKWLYRFSFVGNVGSIFFAYFLVFPSLFKAISINLIDGFWGAAIAFVFTNTFLIIFEIIKRYLIRNFSSDYQINKRITPKIFGWLVFSIAIVLLSFYLSVIGARNLASTSDTKNIAIEQQMDINKDNIVLSYENKKKIYEDDNESLRKINNGLRQKLSETPLGYVSVRRDYQVSIDKNDGVINSNLNEIKTIDEQLQKRIDELATNLNNTKTNNKSEDNKTIVLFIIIAIFVEVMIIGGVYFREWYEYNLYVNNQQKFEKIYQKKDRYRSLLMFVYGNGKFNTGDKVIGGLELKQILSEKTNIQNSNKLVDEFLQDMDRLGIFTTNGKRRYIAMSYTDAMEWIEKFDDAFRIIENMK